MGPEERRRVAAEEAERERAKEAERRRVAEVLANNMMHTVHDPSTWYTPAIILEREERHSVHPTLLL